MRISFYVLRSIKLFRRWYYLYIYICKFICFVFKHFTFIVWLALHGITLLSSDKKLRKLSQKDRQKVMSFFDKFSDKDKYDRDNLIEVLRPDLTDEELMELEKQR